MRTNFSRFIAAMPFSLTIVTLIHFLWEYRRIRTYIRILNNYGCCFRALGSSETEKDRKTLVNRTCVSVQAEHVSTRVQFGNKLETYGVVQEKIAHMALRQYVTEVLCAL